MELQRQNHQIGLDFIGYRASMRARPSPLDRRTRDEEPSPFEDRRHYCDALPPEGMERRPQDIESWRILEWSPTGTFVRLDNLSNQHTWQLSEPGNPGGPRLRYGFWARAELYEVLEYLNVPNAE
jgi:hypothetical protein